MNKVAGLQDKRAGLPVWRAPQSASKEPDAALDWLTGNAPSIRADVSQFGGALIGDLEWCRSASAFDAAISRIIPRSRDYVGGTSPREVVHNKIMTATRTPEDWSIIPHQEMAYTADPPDLIAFFCERPSQDGGASTLTDMTRVLREVDPDIAERFQEHGLQLCRTLPCAERAHLKPGIQKPWEEVFETRERARVDEICIARGWNHEWRGEDLHLWQEVVPAVRTHTLTNAPVWCNQAHFFNPACMIAWAKIDGREKDARALAEAHMAAPELMDRMYLGNGEPVSDDDALSVFHLLMRLQRLIALKASDILVLDNVLTAHGRTAFKGERELLVALGDWD